MSRGNFLFRIRLTELDPKLTLLVTEDRRMYESFSGTGRDFTSVRLLRQARAIADESLSLLPRGGYRSSFVVARRQGRPPGSSARADLHAFGSSDPLFRGGYS